MTVSYPPDGQSTIFETRRANQPTQSPVTGRKQRAWKSSSGDYMDANASSPRRASLLEQAAVEWLDARAQGRSMVVVDAHLTAAIAAAAERA